MKINPRGEAALKTCLESPTDNPANPASIVENQPSQADFAAGNPPQRTAMSPFYESSPLATKLSKFA